MSMLGAVQALAGPGAMPAAHALRTASERHGLDDVAAVLGAWISRRGAPAPFARSVLVERASA